MQRTFSCILFSILLITCTTADAQADLNVLGQLTYSEELSDIWGYADGLGNEYAIVGVFDGVSIVDVTDPSSPQELHFIPGAPSIWRDMKVWNNHAYITNEEAGGLLIIDLNGLPSTINTSIYTGGSLGLNTAHNIFIDENGYAYLPGSDVGAVGDLLILNLSNDPKVPVYAGSYSLRYVHDCFVRGDTLWTAEIGNGIFSVVDVSVKSAPVVMATQATPGFFTHNLWLSDDGKYLFTTDEISDAVIASYDVSDITDISLLDTYQSSPGENVIVHNTFVIGDFIITAYYRDGVTIVDASKPDNLVQTAQYDTSPFSGSGFNGCWGVYPYLPSGNILATDIENGLFIFGPNYSKACYLEGMAIDSSSGAPINAVDVDILGGPASSIASTDISGNYSTGLAEAGTYDVRFSAIGYEEKVVNGIVLNSGLTTLLDVELVALESFTLAGIVIDSLNGMPIPEAHVLLESDYTTFQITTDINGQFSFPSVFTGDYDIYAGQWNFRTKFIPNQNINAATGIIEIAINKGIYDDFLFDFNWLSSSTAASGLWVRDEPLGTTFGGAFSNPDKDITGDFGKECYMTGNGGGSAGSDDVDDGRVTLISPVFDATAYEDPALQYHRWFFNAGGSSVPDDSLVVKISNGISSITVDFIKDGPGESQWIFRDIRIADFITPTENMRITFEAADLASSGHLVEAAIDQFRVLDRAVSSAPVAAVSSSQTTVCLPESITFNDVSTNNPIAWYWSFPGGEPENSTDPNPTVVYNNPGTYDVSLSVLNDYGSDEVTLSNYILAVETAELALSSTPTGDSGNDGTASVVISGGTPPFVIVWDDPEMQSSTTATGLTPGSYTVIVTDANNCSVTATVVVSSINGILTDNINAFFQVMPNPFTKEVFINLKDHQNGEINIYNTQGILIKQIPVNNSNQEFSVGNDWESGVYYLQLSTKDIRSSLYKIIKINN